MIHNPFYEELSLSEYFFTLQRINSWDEIRNFKQTDTLNYISKSNNLIL